MRPFEEKNQILYVDAAVVAEHYNLSSDSVIEWIKEGKISGIQSATNPDHYLVPEEEFEYLKNKREKDDYDKDWDVEMEE